MTTAKTKVLRRDLVAVGIHGITGQQTEIGTLGAGALIRGASRALDSDGETPHWRFLASTDGGKSWYRQLSYERPEAVAYYAKFVEGQGFDAKVYRLEATRERAARREAREFLGGCRVGSGSVALYTEDPRLVDVDPVARWRA